MSRHRNSRSDTAHTREPRKVDLEFEETQDDDESKGAVWFLFLDARGNEKQLWVPRAWLGDFSEASKRVEVPEWWAIENGLV